MDTRLVHTFHDSVELEYRGVPLFRYVYEPANAAKESPRPYFHPVRTLKGNVVTNFRPYDHVWHHGISMAVAYLSGQNFWGGPSFVGSEMKYVDLGNQGSMRHTGWDAMDCAEEGVAMTESLEWVSRDGEIFISEKRSIEVPQIDGAEGTWTLAMGFALKNVASRELVFGSPTTEGRPNAGYGGLAWRGPRSFYRGSILAANDLEGPEVMGQRAPWMAYSGNCDETADRVTMVFVDDPGNPRYPNKWFVRNEPFALASFATWFDEEYPLAPDAELALNYRIGIADGEWSRERIEQYARQAQ